MLYNKKNKRIADIELKNVGVGTQLKLFKKGKHKGTWLIRTCYPTTLILGGGIELGECLADGMNDLTRIKYLEKLHNNRRLMRVARRLA